MAKHRKRAELFAIVVALTVGWATVEAQQPKKIPRIGYLSASSAAEVSPRTEAFRQGLRELGYVEGKSLVIEFRYAEGKFDNLADLAAELVRLNVDVIVTAGPSVTRPARKPPDHPHCHDQRYRSGCERIRRQSCASGREILRD